MKVIFSVARGICYQKDWANTQVIEKALSRAGVKYSGAKGNFHGIKEPSIVVHDVTLDLLSDIKRVASIAKQQCVLIINEEDSSAYLDFGGQPVFIGIFTEVDTVHNGEEYTYVDNKFYIVK